MPDKPKLPHVVGPNIASVDAFVYRAPCEKPVMTSFGIMRERPAVFVRVVDQEGAYGWGEIWCNFPLSGAEHRAHLVDSVFLPLLDGITADPVTAHALLERRTAVLAIQSGEPGPMAQVAAGLDLALWDLAARRAGLPLYQLLGGERRPVPVYASGINPADAVDTVLAAREAGYGGFKLKVGFDRDKDLRNLEQARAMLGDQTPLMADANQAWSLDEARARAAELKDIGLAWLEEPLRADVPMSQWQTLAREAPMPLAAGENMASEAQFVAAIRGDAHGVIQPDVAKWGGITGCYPLVRRVLERGLRYCPHYLGGALGLLASAHLLAAAGGDGMLEVDFNRNPLRSEVAGDALKVTNGTISLPEGPGLGVEPDLDALDVYSSKRFSPGAWLA